MSLEFAPLYFTYNDSWRWTETKYLSDYDENGNKVLVPRSRTYYQKGHCHLFFPGVDPKRSSGQMYWGEQEYTFDIVDEWGPNSGDPIQNKSVRLLGKPIWYFRIEEYWRRMYVQPWDVVDRTCDLPLNQTVQYDRKTVQAYWTELIDEWAASKEDGYLYDDPDDRMLYTDCDPSRLRYPQYLEMTRYAAAIGLYLEDDPGVADDYARWRAENPEEAWQGAEGFAAYLVADEPGNEDGARRRMFGEWYARNAGRHSGYADAMETMKKYMASRDPAISEKKGSKHDTDGNVFVPRDETVGHIGVKYDASLPCHSLGPFREGGEFYFFSTVVNRTMPCEYWLDEDMRTRQYYLKSGSSGEETRGGGTWTFAGDRSKFVWIYDTFDEARELLGDGLYEMPDGSRPGEGSSADGADWYYVSEYYGISSRNHRVPPLGEYQYVTVNGFNAKRLRTDRERYVSETDPDHYSESMTEEQLHWYGTNGKIVRTPYDEKSHIDAMEESDERRRKEREERGYYDEDGWHEGTDPDDPEQETEERTESSGAVHWERRHWTGWFEYGEVVRCARDGRWYRRGWRPGRYDPDRFGDGDDPQQPYWTIEKRQWFPNPPPWLCDGSRDRDGDEPSAEMEDILSSDDVGGDYARSDPWTTVGANRMHRLYWEYSYYFGLARRYWNGGHSPGRKTPPQDPDDDGSGGEGQEIDEGYLDPDTGKAIATDWETRIEDWFEAFGAFGSPDDERQCFLSWLPLLGDLLSRHQDRLAYYRYDDEGNRSEIPDRLIDISSGRYLRRENANPDDPDSWLPLPPPVYVVNYSYYGEGMEDYRPLTYLPFEDFCSVWSPLSQSEISALNLDGDLPVRNGTPFPAPSLDEYVGRDPEGETPLEREDREFKTGVHRGWTEDGALLGESAPTTVKSAFFPRLDNETRAENEARGRSRPPLPAFPLSPLDEGDLVPSDGSLLDPYRNGTVDPIEEWKKYYSHREEFTIPGSTVVLGDRSIENPKGSPNLPFPHPRETSYSREDGARRHYPDDMFVTPIIEYQKVVRTNATATEDGYCRLPGKEEDDAAIHSTYRTARNPAWGDGFSATVTIPYRINGEIQSPFSDASGDVKAPGEYCHGCVPPENRMRYRIDWYDSLDKIRRFDFPSYIDIIHAFQAEHLPDGASVGDGTPVESVSLYREDFNDYEATLAYRGDPKADDIPAGYETWGDCLDAYWRELDGREKFSDHPIVRGRDCRGNEVEENAFELLENGRYVWRERTTHLLPTQDKVEYTMVGGELRPGYLDSKGNLVRGGKVVEFNNPFGEDSLDGKWVEQCLGAVVKAKCLLVLEDALGYRWLQWVDDTAMQPAERMRGRDYDG